ncbi:putative calcium-transporting ATPase 13 [Forsythia ovata]|uniref:Calcium-transporting ATPase 13 n=1 Tax=Forsythia ovata TaxID=205694 RepID=A0ABD1UZS9_9LAMI
MTRELSNHVEINQAQNPFLFSGTNITDGNATMLVTSVGMDTTWGEMVSTISRDSIEQTPPLQTRLNKSTSSIGKVNLEEVFLVLVVLLVRYFKGNTTDEHGSKRVQIHWVVVSRSTYSLVLLQLQKDCIWQLHLLLMAFISFNTS